MKIHASALALGMGILMGCASPLLANVATVNFNNLSPGYLASPYADPGGYTFSSQWSATNGNDAFYVYDTSQGYSGKVLINYNWSSKIVITKTGGGTFDIVSFDYGSDPWGGLADATVTAGNYSTTISSSSKTLATKILNWTGITSLTIDYTGGVNNAYGAVGNFVFGVTFQNLPTGYLASPYADPSGYTFSSQWSATNGNDAFYVYDTSQGYSGKVLLNYNWSSKIVVTRTDGGIFDIVSFDYGSDPWGGLADATVTAGNYSTTISSSSKTLATKILNWTGITSLTIDYAGGANNAYGAVGNFVFGSGGSHGISDRYFGMNIDSPADVCRWPLLADAAKSARWLIYGTWNYGWDTVIDSAGNPNQDFSMLLFDTNYGTNGQLGGTYSISFNGAANVNLASGTGTLSINAYDSVNNKTTGTLVLPADPVQPYLSFSNTQRTSSSPTNTGITNLKIMRPSNPGSSASLSEATVFTPQIIATLKNNFNVLREMGNIEYGGNDWEDSWDKRTLPAAPQWQEVSDGRYYGVYPNGWTRTLHQKGMSWEYHVMLANETGCDMWLNIPIAANDDYVTKLAQLIKYGSDGTNPYTSIQNSPVYPPLKSGRKVYIEMGNELWNWAQPYWYNTTYVHTQAKATPSNHPIRFDGMSESIDENILSYRWIGWRLRQMSNLFSAVWGNSAMMTAIRPVISGQQSSGYTGQAVQFLHNYYNNGDGTTHVLTPQQVNSYIYGLGDSFYLAPTDFTSVDSIFSTLNSGIQPFLDKSVEVSSAWAKGFGLAHVSYEGGIAFGDGSSGGVKAQALLDPRMRTWVSTLLQSIEGYGWDGGCHFSLGGWDDQGVVPASTTWEYVPFVYNPYLRPKMQGIQDLRNTSSKNSITVGVQTGSTPFLAAAYTENSGWVSQMHDKTAASIPFNQTGIYEVGMGYLIRAPSAGTYSLSVQYSGASATTLRVVSNGYVAGTLSMPPSGAATWSGTISLCLGSGLNGIRLYNLTNAITMYNIEVQ